MISRGRTELSALPIPTDLGIFIAHYSATGLAALDFPGQRSAVAPPKISPASGAVEEWHRINCAAVNRILSGKAPDSLPPFDISSGSPFQQSVWRALLAVPFGETRTYGEIADAIGNPKALRAVGAACGSNCIPVLIPCHRVIAARRKIGGFSGGIDWKRILLEREGVFLSGTGQQPVLF